jgi:hypothetical protein
MIVSVRHPAVFLSLLKSHILTVGQMVDILVMTAVQKDQVFHKNRRQSFMISSTHKSEMPQAEMP